MGVTGPEEFGDRDSWVWCHMLHPGFGKSHVFLVVHYPSASQVGSRSCRWSFFPPWLDLFLGRLSLWTLSYVEVDCARSSWSGQPRRPGSWFLCQSPSCWFLPPCIAFNWRGGRAPAGGGGEGTGGHWVPLRMSSWPWKGDEASRFSSVHLAKPDRGQGRVPGTVQLTVITPQSRLS